MKKKLIVLISAFVLVLAIGFFLNIKYYSPQNSPQATPTPSSNISVKPTPTNTETSTPQPTTSSIPESYLIKNFSFQSQAPYANWDELHDEACEEAALILVYYYLNDKTLSAATMEEQIQKMVSWEIENYGSHKDLTIQETGNLAKSFYSMSNFKIENDISIEDIKREVANNHPVIIPTAGRLLGNPYFRSPGPVYHMLVVIGYNGNTIIVQDIGTRRGDHYEYNEKILYNAIHDWNGTSDNIQNGKKTMLVFE